jgi:hypothetical protein
MQVQYYTFSMQPHYITKVQSQLVAQHYFFNSPTCFGLTYRSSSGSLLWHVQCIFQPISYNFHKGLRCVYSSQNGSCAMYVECRNNNVIPVVINWGNIPRQRDIKELQKIVILGTAHMFKNCQCEVQNIYRGEITVHYVCHGTEWLHHYTHRNIDCFR